MPCHKDTTQESGDTAVASRDMDPLPANFGPVFFQNQFLTKIELPTRERYPDVEGKCAIVTGSNVGLGLETSKQLLSLGLSHLVMGVRSLEKGNSAADELRNINPMARIEVWHLDMESYESVQAFARTCQGLERIDMVILNAGLLPMDFVVSPTGHERTIQVNHLSTVLLGILLLPTLKSKSTGSQPPRLTIVNSVLAHLCKLSNKDQRPLLPSFDDTDVTPWDPQERYGASKLLCQLFFVKLSEIVSAEDVIINMVDPGLTKGTSMARHAKGLTSLVLNFLTSVAGRPVERGAATYVDAAMGQGKESHGCFLMNCKIAPLAGWFYKDDDSLMDLVWKETLQELSFVGVNDVVATLRSA